MEEARGGSGDTEKKGWIEGGGGYRVEHYRERDNMEMLSK